MKPTIYVKYLPATRHSPAKIKAEGKQTSCTEYYDMRLSEIENASRVANNLAKKLNLGPVVPKNVYPGWITFTLATMES